MTAGLPGTGLGGMFYMLLVLLMPLRELYLTLRGRSTLARWGSVARHWVIAAGILVALYGGAWLVKQLAFGLIHLGLLDPGLRQQALHATAVSSSTALVISLSLLGLVTLVPAGLYLLLGSRPTPVIPLDQKLRDNLGEAATAPAAPARRGTDRAAFTRLASELVFGTRRDQRYVYDDLLRSARHYLGLSRS